VPLAAHDWLAALPPLRPGPGEFRLVLFAGPKCFF
jgi:hypothetical protein